MVTEQVRKITVLQVVHALALEINTGLRVSSRGTALDAARIQHIIPAGRTTRKAALRVAVDLLQELEPEWSPTGSILRALSK